ncbi:uncharacterized protein BO66DRAFT_388039 [Aspergillus aculeatinus CBS 121060]|uniref:Uncharacterized protein n=1 Tax=Aspergillus aculeatinus CBS 121060 TaxID=1448322 RepID=A0ACD1HM70_9EURO|nr:hypothetical protein BO66DRAFT_388039 [Aspergillus aculeatinus CBS 121060]RAH74567.1 hypothetical protein BO66DRAFT_388039 [Aspergillus aculeatinus CBS 121060]
MEATIDLGRADFHSSDSTSTLTMNVSIFIQSRRRPQIAARDMHLIHLMTMRMAWVTEAPEIKLNLFINAHNIPNVTVSTFVPVVGEMLCNAKLWKELGLVIMYKSCEYFDQKTPPSFQLAFGIGRSLTQPALLPTVSRRVPRAMQTPGDLIPPPYIETISISTININLDFMPTDPEVQPHPPALIMASLGEMAWKAPSPEFEELVLESTTFQSSELDKGDIPEFSDTRDFTEELADMDNSPDSTVLSSPPTEPAARSCNANHQALHHLLRAGLSYLLIGNSHEQGQTEPDPATVQLQSLSRMAPSVFSPGYSMCQRSLLITSLVKSLTSMLKLPMNHSLRQIVSSMKVAYVPDSLPLTAVDMGNIIHAAFWTLAQKQLYKAEASQKLSRLDEINPTDLDEAYAHESLLITGSTEEVPNCFNHAATEKVDMASEDYLGTEDYFELDCTSQTNSLLSVDENCTCSVNERSWDTTERGSMEPAIASQSPCPGFLALISDIEDFEEDDDMMYKIL